MRAALTWLAKSASVAVLINLEDLWMEAAPQNLPGTGLERPNWRRKARYRLDDLTSHRHVTATLRAFAEAHTHGRAPSKTPHRTRS